MKKCPFCAEEIQDEAIKCRYCHEMLPAAPQLSMADPNEAAEQSSQERTGDPGVPPDDPVRLESSTTRPVVRSRWKVGLADRGRLFIAGVMILIGLSLVFRFLSVFEAGSEYFGWGILFIWAGACIAMTGLAIVRFAIGFCAVVIGIAVCIAGVRTSRAIDPGGTIQGTASSSGTTPGIAPGEEYVSPAERAAQAELIKVIEETLVKADQIDFWAQQKQKSADLAKQVVALVQAGKTASAGASGSSSARIRMPRRR